MNSLLQTGHSGRGLVPPEKRFLIILMAVGVLRAGVARAEIQVDAAPPGAPEEGAKPSVAAPAADGMTPSATGTDVLTFLNGDRLHGSLLAAVPAGFGLKWRGEDMETPAAIALRQLDRVRFGRKAKPGAKDPQAQVRLSNEDALRGEIVSLEGDTLTLKTSYAGNLSLQRSMLSQIWPGKAARSLIYEGPEDMTGWELGNSRRGRGGWSFKDGKLICTSQSPIARDLKDLPDLATIQFAVACSGPYLQMNVGFCGDNIQSVGGNTYFLQFSGNSGALYRNTNNSGNRNLGPGFQLDQGRNEPLRKATIEILLNRPKKQIALVINGQFIRQWTDPDGFPGTGKVLLFQCHDGMRYTIGGIKVAAWDGRIAQGDDSADSDTATDVMVLANGDKVSGKLVAIKAGAVKFETSYAALDIPLARITEISFGKEGRQKARLNKADIQCQFVGGGTVTLALVSLEHGQIAGKSENFGDIKLAASALDSITFNPWSRPVEDTKEEPVDDPEDVGVIVD